MKIKSLLAAGACAGALLGLATNGLAQALPSASPAAAPSAPPITHGPPIAGLCVFNEQAAIGQSLVGKAAAARFQQLISQANAELAPLASGIETDGRALQAARGTLDEPTYEKRAADLNLRGANMERLKNERQQELQYTWQKALGRIHQAIVPVLTTTYEQHNCSILFDGQAVLTANGAMDITPGVATGLNATMTTITFDREAPPAQPGQAGAQGPQQ